MGAVSYARPRLTTAQDPRYRAHVEQFVIQRNNQRAMRPPSQRDIFSMQAETVIRDWVGRYVELSDRRILEYEQRYGNRAIIKYRELDAVCIEDKHHAWVCEIKASRSANSLHRAIKQLEETRAILSLLYPTVSTTILFVDTGIPTREEVAEIMAGENPPKRPPKTLSGCIEARDNIQVIHSLDERRRDATMIDLLVLPVDDVVAMAGDGQELALDWSDDHDQEWYPAPAPSTPIYSTSDDADEADAGESALADALRRAGFNP
jgi:hypothetical protein